MFLVHHDDLAKLIGAMVDRDNGPSYVVAAHPCQISFKELLNTLGKRTMKKMRFVSIPGRLAIVLLAFAEAFRIKLPFRKDSLVSLLNPNTNLDFSGADGWGIEFRNFSDE